VCFLRGGRYVRTPVSGLSGFGIRRKMLLLTGARRRLWPGEIDPVRVVDHAIEKARQQCHELLGKSARNFLTG
jgi:hypothetical protein